MVSVSYLFEDVEDTGKELTPEAKFMKSNTRKNLLIAGLIGAQLATAMNLLINRINASK